MLQVCCIKPGFHLLRHDTTCLTCLACGARSDERVALVVHVAPCLFQQEQADDEEAVVLACTSLVFCALDLHQSQEQHWKKWGGHVHPSPRCGDALNTCRASRACRDDHVALCCPTSETQHVTTFSCAKMHGLDSVSWRDVTQQVEFQLYLLTL